MISGGNAHALVTGSILMPKGRSWKLRAFHLTGVTLCSVRDSVRKRLILSEGTAKEIPAVTLGACHPETDANSTYKNTELAINYTEQLDLKYCPSPETRNKRIK